MIFLDITYEETLGPGSVFFGALDYQPQEFKGTEGYVILSLDEGQSASSRAKEAAILLRRQIIDAGGPQLELREEYSPQEVDQAERDRQRFERRALAHNRLSAEFGAWNLGRVRRGEFTPLEIDAWLSSTPIRTILDKLRLYSFEVALALIAALPLGGPTTAEFKSTWSAKLEAEL